MEIKTSKQIRITKGISYCRLKAYDEKKWVAVDDLIQKIHQVFGYHKITHIGDDIIKQLLEPKQEG